MAWDGGGRTTTAEPVALPTNPYIYEVTHYILAGCYLVLAVSTLCIVVFKAFNKTLRETWKVFFFLFVMAGAALRGAWAALCPLELTHVIEWSNRTEFYLNLAPSFLFFSNYLILLFVWAELYHYHGMTIKRLRMHLAITLVVMYAGALAVFIVDLVMYDSSVLPVSSAHNVPQHVLIIYLAALYIITSVAFGIYAVLILVPLIRRGAAGSPERTRLIVRLLALTGLIVVMFLFRAAMVFIGYFVDWSIINWFDLVYYGGCEVMPVWVMLCILLYRGPKTTATAAAAAAYDERSALITN